MLNPDFSTADHDSLPITEEVRDLLLRDEAPYLRVESDVVVLKQLIFCFAVSATWLPQ
jgi:hypothetical protein